MPVVTVRAIEGRTVEQKRKLAKDITDAVVKNFDVEADKVLVNFFDIFSLFCRILDYAK